MTAATTHNLDDYVTIHPLYAREGDDGRVFQITKVPTRANEVNYIAKPVVGGGRGTRAPGYFFVPATPAARDAALARAAAEPTREPLVMGHLVSVTDVPKLASTDYCVVLGAAPRRRDAVELVRLGGEDPRVWSPVPERLCTVVDPASVLRPVAGDAADGRLAPASTYSTNRSSVSAPSAGGRTSSQSRSFSTTSVAPA